MTCIPCLRKQHKNKKPKDDKALDNNFFSYEKWGNKQYASWLKIKFNNLLFNMKVTDFGRKGNKHVADRPMVVHRGCSKGLNKEALLINELRKEYSFILRAEHGNYGEDAFFVVQSDKHLLFGVADGVGGWTELGIDPGLFSASLVKHGCRNSLKIIQHIEKDIGSSCIRNYNISALTILSAAFRDLLKFDRDTAFGSSTACFGVYNYKTKELNIANLGDSGIYLRTGGKVEFLTPMLSECNAPVQLSNPPKKMRKIYQNPTSPHDSDLYSFQLSDGDFFIVGSDGVWDNIDVQNVRSSFIRSTFKTKWPYNVMKKQNMADGFADDLFGEVVENSQSPFRYARINDAKNPNIACHGKFYGGKKDDITLIMVLV